MGEQKKKRWLKGESSMFAVVEHNFQEVVVIVYCRFFAKAKKKCFRSRYSWDLSFVSPLRVAPGYLPRCDLM